MAVLKTSIIFTIGCIVLVVNAALSFLPFIGLKVDLPKQIIYVEGLLSVLSCGLFLIGSSIAFQDSLRASDGRGGYFGWGLEDRPVVKADDDQEKGECGEKAEEVCGAKIDEEVDEKAEEELQPQHAHFMFYKSSSHEALFDHRNWSRQALSRQPDDPTLENGELATRDPPPPYTETAEAPGPRWGHQWATFLSGHGLREEYCNLGLLASTIFLISSLIYTMTALASFVTILTWGEVFRPIRYPQLVAGSGFTIGSFILLIKTQKDKTKHWWKPAPARLAWQVNFWNLVGSAGFVFCAYFGLLAHVHWSDYQFNCTYLWGSCFFLAASMIQWFKARHKHL